MNVIGELKIGEHQHLAHSTPEANNEAGEHVAPDTWPQDSSSSDTLRQDLDRQREDARARNPRGLSRAESGVDVERAEAEFAQLSRELSGLSQNSRRASRQISRVQSRRSIPKEVDVEKIASSGDSDAEPWDLAEVLRGTRAADHEAGIKSKQIGNDLPIYSHHDYTETLAYRRHMGECHRQRHRWGQEYSQDLS